jgi:hypothetical protein
LVLNYRLDLIAFRRASARLSKNIIGQFKPADHLAKIARQNVFAPVARNGDRTVLALDVRMEHDVVATLAAINKELETRIVFFQYTLELVMLLRPGHRPSPSFLALNKTFAKALLEPMPLR